MLKTKTVSVRITEQEEKAIEIIKKWYRKKVGIELKTSSVLQLGILALYEETGDTTLMKGDNPIE